MEDDNGLELSLGLGCGGSSAKSKGKNSSSSDTRAEDSDRSNKLVDDFRNFLNGNPIKPDSGSASQRSDTVKPSENLFTDLSKANADVDASINVNNMGLWVSNSSSRSAEIEEEKRLEAGSKRKMSFQEMNIQKKHASDVHHADSHDKKTSHISINTDDGSTAENEDVAESEVEGSTSRLVSQYEDGSRWFVGVGGPSEVPKDSDLNVTSIHAQKKPNGPSENELKHGNVNYGVPFSVQPVNIMNVPYGFPAKDSIGSASVGQSLTGMRKLIPTSNGEQQKGTQAVDPSSLPSMFGYSSIQLPTLDKDSSWGSVSHHQQFHPSFVGRGPSNADKHSDGLKISQAAQVVGRNSSEAVHYDGRTSERTKGDGKQQITEEGSSSQTEGGDAKGSSVNVRARDVHERPTAEVLPSEFSAIKPGIGTVVKFGGCGSYPKLPWVSTTAPGPNGKTISGVTYRYSANQIKIVCACHGTHMSPEEFVRHAREENANPETGSASGLATFQSTNPAASTQS